MQRQTHPYLVVRADRLLCALDLATVEEVLRPLEVATVADAPPALAGLSVVRGRSLPILDLRHFLGRESAAEPTRWVVLRAPGAFALAVDAVDSVRWLDDLALGPAKLLSEVAAGAVAGIGTLDRDVLVHLQGARIFAALEPYLDSAGQAES